MEKPKYIIDFDKPKNTEIKYINGNWYLYERYNYYDPVIKRSRKKSGKLLGKITEQGFIESKKKTAIDNSYKNDIVEIGASNYFINMTSDIAELLEKHFPDYWKEIYVLALIRAIFNNRFRRATVHYEDSILSYIYPDLNFDSRHIKNLLQKLGRQRNEITAYMEDSMGDNDRFILIDGHRLISSSSTVENAELGYDSKRRYKPQINLIYMFSIGENTGMPVYYKQFIGSTPDVTAFSDILKESHNYGKDCTIVGDKGFACEEDFELLDDNNLKYIIPLKRKNIYAKNHIPSSPIEYMESFTFNERAIQSKTVDYEEFNIHIFFDADLFAQELADMTIRTEKKNNTTEEKRKKEEELRENKKGKLTQEELDKLKPITHQDMLNDKAEIGTLTIKTNRKDLNSAQVYSIYKQRQSIEQYFKTYSCTLDFESSYMKDNYSEEAWLFLNHITSIMTIRVIEHIADINETKNISYNDLVQTLSKIKAQIVSNNDWRIAPIKKSVIKMCEKLDYNPNNFEKILPQE